MVPYTHYAKVTKAAINGRDDVVTTSYASPAMRELDRGTKMAGMNEISLGAGIDHLYAIKIIDEVRAKG